MTRYVLTGAPGAGKTAILRALEVAGYPVVEEAATDVIALAHARGVDEPWTDPAFVDEIVALQRRREAAAPADGAVFFDRSPLCTLALSRHLGFPASGALAGEVDRVLRDRVYDPTVLFVRPLGRVEPTAARRISWEDALRFERVHERTYTEYGFRLVDVPPGPLADRVAAVLAATAQP